MNQKQIGSSSASANTNAHHFAPQARLPKTPKQVRAEFDRQGLSIAAWARLHQVSRSLVYEILAGRKKCHRGQSHKIAVLLGLKEGEIGKAAEDFDLRINPTSTGTQ